jgi:hypothetical protein
MQTRSATSRDADEIARVHVATWQRAYRNQIPNTILDALDARERANVWREVMTKPGSITFVAESAG